MTVSDEVKQFVLDLFPKAGGHISNVSINFGRMFGGKGFSHEQVRAAVQSLEMEGVIERITSTCGAFIQVFQLKKK
jgi:DNA-binding transcriptional regulator PaaX